MEAIKRVVDILGGQQVDLAKKLGVSEQAVSKWLHKGVPTNRILDICRASDWQVTPYELDPETYPDPDWLPPEATQAANQ